MRRCTTEKKRNGACELKCEILLCYKKIIKSRCGIKQHEGRKGLCECEVRTEHLLNSPNRVGLWEETLQNGSFSVQNESFFNCKIFFFFRFGFLFLK